MTGMTKPLGAILLMAPSILVVGLMPFLASAQQPIPRWDGPERATVSAAATMLAGTPDWPLPHPRNLGWVRFQEGMSPESLAIAALHGDVVGGEPDDVGGAYVIAPRGGARARLAERLAGAVGVRSVKPLIGVRELLAPSPTGR